MVAYLALLAAEVRRGVQMQIRYPLSALAEMLGLLIALLAAVAGMDAYVGPGGPPGLVGPPGSVSLSGFAALPSAYKGASLVSLMALFAALVGLQGPSKVVRDEADMGTLEQLCMGHLDLRRIIFVRVVADALRLIPTLLIILVSAAAIAHVPASMPLYQVSILFFLTGTGMLGWGLMVASLVLLFKRIGFLTNLFSLAMLPLAFLPEGSLPGPLALAAGTVPFRWSVAILQRMAAGRLTILGLMGTREVAWLAGSSLISSALGILIFASADRIARVRGLLGKY